MGLISRVSSRTYRLKNVPRWRLPAGLPNASSERDDDARSSGRHAPNAPYARPPNARYASPTARPSASNARSKHSSNNNINNSSNSNNLSRTAPTIPILTKLREATSLNSNNNSIPTNNTHRTHKRHPVTRPQISLFNRPGL